MRPRPTLLTLLIAGALAVGRSRRRRGAREHPTGRRRPAELRLAHRRALQRRRLLPGDGRRAVRGRRQDGAIDVTVRDNLASGGDASLENAVREAAASGDFDLIVAHGFDLVPAVAKFAPEYPDQLFATSLPVEGEPANVEIYLSAFEEIGYNAGFLAAQGTTAGSVGFIGGPGLPFELQSEAGFRQAVAEYAPDASVTVVYTGTFEDPQLAQEAATQMIGDGVDSIWNQQAAGQSGVYTACAAASRGELLRQQPLQRGGQPGRRARVDRVGLHHPGAAVGRADPLRLVGGRAGPAQHRQRRHHASPTPPRRAPSVCRTCRPPSTRTATAPPAARSSSIRPSSAGDGRGRAHRALGGRPRDDARPRGGRQALRQRAGGRRRRPDPARRRGARPRRRERSGQVDVGQDRRRAGAARCRARSASTARRSRSAAARRRRPSASASCTNTSASFPR